MKDSSEKGRYAVMEDLSILTLKVNNLSGMRGTSKRENSARRVT